MDKIAIVGMGCLFPGAETPDQYWENLLAENDAATLLDEEILGVGIEKYFNSKSGTPDKISYHKNGYVRNFKFCPEGYQLSPEKLENLDDLFKWTLYTADEALKDAKQSTGSAHKCGLILGNIGMPTHSGKRMLNGFYNQMLEPYIQRLLSNDDFHFQKYWDTDKNNDPDNLSPTSYNAIITAQALGLGGPVFTIDAACSSAIYAINLASFYLNSGKADMMLSGAVCHADHIYIGNGFNMLRAFPDIDENSIPFDKNSRGLKSGEGAGIVVLKRLADAQRDGDKIYGVIDSIGLSNDAGAKHILVPDVSGQVEALKRAYAHDSEQIDYLECHATGTPVGDQVELNSVEQFFTEYGKLPLIGANKGNVGHMLTASGMASILKVLLAMEHNVIPATIQLENMVATKGGKLNIDSVVRKAIPWPNNGINKRAGINGFGFGGVNGHMVLSSAELNQQTIEPNKKTIAPMSLAITGMSVAMAANHGLSEFNATIEHAEQAFNELPRSRWSGLEERADLFQPYGVTDIPKGAYIEKFDFDCKRFKLPPNMAGIHLLSHLSLMQLAAGAFYDAGYTMDGKKRNIAVIVAVDNEYLCYRYQARNEAAWQVRDSLEKSGIELTEERIELLETIIKDSLFPEPYTEGITGGIGNVVASRISSSLKLNGPAFTVSAQENSVFRAIELAEFLLSLDDMEAVIVGSGSFCGGFESVLFAHQQHAINTGQKTLSFDIASKGRNIGEGGGVVLLKSKQRAITDGDSPYACIESLSFSHALADDAVGAEHKYPSSSGVALAANLALEQAGVKAADIAYLEAHASGIGDEDQAEFNGLTQVYGADGRSSAKAKKTVLGSVKSNYGHLGAAAGMASIIKAALCIQQRYLPATPYWKQAKQQALLDASNLRVTTTSEPWEKAATGRSRYAAVSSMGRDLAYAHLILKEAEGGKPRTQSPEIDMEELRKNALLKVIYIGRETPIPQMIVNQANYEKLGTRPSIPEPKEVLATAQASLDVDDIAVVATNTHSIPALMLFDMRQREVQRGKLMHLNYLKTEQQFYRRLNSLMGTQVAIPEFIGAVADIKNYSGAQDAKVIPFISPQGFLDGSENNSVSVAGKNRLDEIEGNIVFNYQQLVEMTDGSVEKVLGSWYAEADQYPIRTRMPSPPYLFVSRVTKLTAQREKLEPCIIEWEYDLPAGEWYAYHGLVPAFVTLESSHAMIVAFTFIGCDQIFKGELKYRAIDSSTEIYGEMPKIGDVLKGRVQIQSFTKVGKNILIRYEYDGYVKDRHCFKLTATSGFFPLKEIEKAKVFNAGKIFTNATKSSDFTPFIVCEKKSFSDDDVIAIQNGNLDQCFTIAHGKVASPGLYAEKAKMLDRVLHVDPKGGAWGLGQVLGERDVDPTHWAFKAHFKNDPVLPGTLIVEGAEQLVRFYLYYIGLHTFKYLKPTIVDNHKYSAKFRGEVKCIAAKLQYRLSVKRIEIIRNKETNKISEALLIFIAETIYQDKVIGVCDDLGSRFVSTEQS